MAEVLAEPLRNLWNPSIVVHPRRHTRRRSANAVRHRWFFTCIPYVVQRTPCCGEISRGHHRRRGNPSKDAQGAVLGIYLLDRLLTRGFKLLAREVIGWRWLQHENILSFVGVTPDLAIVSDLMEHGNIREFIANNPRHNRLQLVSNTGTSDILI